MANSETTPSSNGKNQFLGHCSEALSQFSELFFFSYSTLEKTLVNWSPNTLMVLGVKDLSLARDGNLFLRHVHDDDRFLLLTDLERALTGELPYRATYRWVRPDNNEVRWLHCRATLNTQHSQPLFEGVIFDLSQEFTGTIGRLAGPDSVGNVLAAFPTIAFTVDRDLRLVRINRPADNIDFNFGDRDFRASALRIGRPLLNCFGNEDSRKQYETVLKSIIEGKQNSFRTRIDILNRVYSLEITPINEGTSTSGLLFTIADITEVATLERRLAELNKSEGLRILASGVAHNFNNALQGILGHATAIGNHPSNLLIVEKATKSITEIVSRASDLAKQLIIWDESNTNNLKQVDLNLSVMAAVNSIEDLFSSGFKVAVAFGTPPSILANQNLLSRAIESLLRNSMESMPEGGNIAVKTYAVDLSNFQIQDLKAGPYAKLSVVDSGSGMSPTTRQRCLEPFFTTKSADPHTGINLEGRGLGLFQALNDIRELGGGIQIDSQVGQGTSIAIYLPACCPTEKDTFNSEFTSQSPSPEILLYDRDPLFLQSIQLMIRELGYSVITTDDSRRALAIARSLGSQLKLLLISTPSPDTDAASLVKKLLRCSKCLKILEFGESTKEDSRKLHDSETIQCLQKPVSAEQLKEALKRHLLSLRAA